jgi:hypothetical protein
MCRNQSELGAKLRVRDRYERRRRFISHFGSVLQLIYSLLRCSAEICRSGSKNVILISLPLDPMLSLLILALRRIPGGHEIKIWISVSVQFEILMSWFSGRRVAGYCDRTTQTFQRNVLQASGRVLLLHYFSCCMLGLICPWRWTQYVPPNRHRHFPADGTLLSHCRDVLRFHVG